jgi:hypothetical protein
MNQFRAIVTVILIAAFAALMVFLLSEVGVSQVSWERYVYLLSGVEAIVFAAVGWLFGKEVHRQQAQQAEAKAEQASAGHVVAASEAAAEKERGLALARAVLSHAGPLSARAASPASEAEPARAEMTVTAPLAPLATLATLAREAYPELGEGKPS